MQLCYRSTLTKGKRSAHSIRRKLTFLLFAVPVVYLTDPAAAQTELKKLHISMSSTGMPSIQLFIAREKGFFREEGFDPQLIRMSANAAIAAGVAGELDALGSVGSAVRGIMRGAPLRIISVDLRRPIFWLVSRGEFRSAKKLKGKVLGIVDDQRQPALGRAQDARPARSRLGQGADVFASR
jgi:ABC-type nitrate/sulfonate/bicarbonate transport system substrate-binding protein